MIRRALLLFLFLTGQAVAAPVFDQVTVGKGSFVDVGSFNVTLGGGCFNSMLPLSIAWYDFNDAVTVSTLTVEGAAAAHIITAGYTAHRQLAMYSKTGIGGTVTIDFSLSGAVDTVTVAVPSYCNVHQSTPIGTPATAQDVSGNSTVDVSSASGETVVGAMLVRGDSNSGQGVAVGGGQTERFNEEAEQLDYFIHVGSDEAGAGTVTTSYTRNNDDNWSIVAVSMKSSVVATRRLGGAHLFQ